MVQALQLLQTHKATIIYFGAALQLKYPQGMVSLEGKGNKGGTAGHIEGNQALATLQWGSLQLQGAREVNVGEVIQPFQVDQYLVCENVASSQSQGLQLKQVSQG